jgi:predicted membrane-bound mannosyltransferase
MNHPLVPFRYEYYRRCHAVTVADMVVIGQRSVAYIDSRLVKMCLSSMGNIQAVSHTGVVAADTEWETTSLSV